MLALALALACAPKSSTPSAPLPEDDGSVNWEREMMQLHMSEHFTRAAQARDHVIAGRLDEARAELSWLAEHDAFPGEPATYGSFMTDMRTIAETGVAARDAEGLAACIGGLGNTCGGCHQSLNVAARIPGSTGPAPDNNGGVHGHAARHGWAVDHLWIGLVKPDDAAWQGGLDAIRAPVFDMEGLGVPEEAAGTVAAYGMILSNMGQEQVGSADAGGRAELFGRVVSSCAGCHAAVR